MPPSRAPSVSQGRVQTPEVKWEHGVEGAALAGIFWGTRQGCWPGVVNAPTGCGWVELPRLSPHPHPASPATSPTPGSLPGVYPPYLSLKAKGLFAWDASRHPGRSKHLEEPGKKQVLVLLDGREGCGSRTS